MGYIHLLLIQWHIWPVLMFFKYALWVGFMLYVVFLPFYIIDKTREFLIIGFSGTRDVIVAVARRVDWYLRR